MTENQQKLNDRLFEVDLYEDTAITEIERLVKIGADINAFNTSEDTLLMTLVDVDSVDDVDKLIRLGADINLSNSAHDTALTVACKDECREGMVIELLEKGADPNLNHPLNVAVSYGNMDVIPDLLKHKADVNGLDQMGKTPIMLLAERGEDVLRRDIVDRDAAEENDKEAMKEALEESFEYESGCAWNLLEAGANINLLDLSGKNAIHIAARSGNKKILEVFLEFNKDDLDISVWKEALGLAKEFKEKKCSAVIENMLLQREITVFDNPDTSLDANRKRTKARL